MKKDRIFAGLTLVLALVLGTIVFRYPPESSYFQRGILVFLFLMGTAALLDSLGIRAGGGSGDPDDRAVENGVRENSPGGGRESGGDNLAAKTEIMGFGAAASRVLVILVLYLAALALVNYEIATVIFFIVSIFSLGYRKAASGLIVSLALSALLYFIFFQLLGIDRPASLLFS